ncbi:helix-turn-helix transcriptional regulator [Halothiobacillus neapolitanus]|uniref:Transcriptional regulator, AraC family n=1 Tax=Halothiobacillus neapolitanus (strain ATCC 23641 / DSM 15147 / CIP 104769 / NCIMB 8539 / c2) TaxID=555778 RepID=D0KWJ3_HALNC|nr:AraC family transcriptional regulator [Halothiobacillus neapolitanus]ACX94990.1 transcriptional regulator, AraC family [Halothiobacillus neapolitanus c2]TDN61058.1 AraC family transcriptional regulator [Halothiobacillus neapolitanus]
MALFEFSSAGQRGTEQLDAAVAHYAQIGRVLVEPDQQSGFAYNARIMQERPLAVGSLSVTAARVTRTRAHAAEGNPYDVLGVVLDAGEVEVSLEGRAPFRYAHGEAFLWRGDEAGRSHYLSPQTRLLNIALPRATLEGGLAHPDRAEGRRLAASPEFRLLAAYATAFLDVCPKLAPESTQTVALQLQDLALLALGANRDSAEQARNRGVRAARLVAIKSDVEAHLLDPELSVRWVLRRHRISERYLRALFADEASSFGDFVLERRLARAWLRLIDPRQHSTPIGVIAAESGFGDPSWFNRAFRRRFGVSPSEARAIYLTGNGADRC